MRLATVMIGLTILIAASIVLANSAPSISTNALDPGNRFQPRARQHRVIAGDLCGTAVSLGRDESLEVDLCQAWNDYDPGSFGCSPCSLPGPEIVASLDVQAGEYLRLSVTMLSGSADVRVYLATDCDDPAGTCIAASDGPGADFQHTVTGAGEIFLFIDTTGECGSVEVSRAAPASAHATTFSALKAVYR